MEKMEEKETKEMGDTRRDMEKMEGKGNKGDGIDQERRGEDGH